MKKGTLVLYCGILLIVALMANIVVTIFLADNNKVVNIVTATACILSFVVILTLVLFKIKSYRYSYFVFLMLLFPCIFYENITDGIDPWRLNSDSGFKVSVGGFLWSIIMGLGVPFYNKSPYSYQYFNLNNAVVIYSAYSLFLTVIITLGLIQIRSTSEMFKLYIKNKYFILLSLTSVTIIILLTFKSHEKINYFSFGALPLIYIFSYFLILFVFFKTKDTLENKWFYAYFLLCLIFLFPVISVSNNIVNTITTDTTPYFDRAIAITPVISALPTTIFYLFKDPLIREMDGLNGLYSVKLYTLLQIFLVVLIFPSVLTQKTEDNHYS